MLEYTARRILLVLPTMVVASIIVFSIARLVPGDTILPPFSGRLNITPEQVSRELGLDEPVLPQYFKWLGGILQGDLGTSIFTHRNVAGEIWKRGQVTLELAGISLAISLIVGLSSGLASAVKRGSPIDYATRVMGAIGVAMPFFWLASLFILGAGWLFGYQPPLRYPSGRRPRRQPAVLYTAGRDFSDREFHPGDAHSAIVSFRDAAAGLHTHGPV